MAAISVQEGGGGDYTSLEAAVENASTVDGDVITISGTWSAREDTRIAVADALTIQTSGSSMHPGRPWTTGDTHYQHRSTSNTSGHHSFTITDTGTIVFDGLDIQHAGTGVSNEIFRNNVSNTLTVKNCLLGFASRTDQQDIYYNEKVATVTFEQCHFYNAYRAVLDLWTPDAGSVININSCTGYDIGYSTSSTSRSGLIGRSSDATSNTINIFNTICHINTGALVSNPAGTNLTSNLHTVITNSATLVQNETLDTDTNNVTSATITDSTASAAYILEDTTTSPFDLRLTDHANNTAQDNHTNGTGTGTGLSVPSTDIIGTSRPQNTNYDIGAFEIVAGGGVTVSLTGQAVTSAQGTVTATGGAIVSLTGQSATASQGTLTVVTGGAVTVALSGQSITSAQGLVTATGAAVVGLSGQEITSSFGTLVVTGAASVSLSGQEATFSQGTVTVTTAAAPTIVSLLGQSITSNIGTIGLQTANVISLSGQEVTMLQGSVTAGTPPVIPDVVGVTVGGRFGEGISATLTFGEGVTRKGRL